MENEEAAEVWRRAQETLAEVDEQRARWEREKAERAERELHDPNWQPPRAAPQPAPVQRQPEPSAPPRPKPAPAPPIPSKVMHTRHDSAGRVIEVTSYEGSAAVATVSWENWIKQYVNNSIEAFAGALGDEIGKWDKDEREKAAARLAEEGARLEALIAEQAAQIETLSARLKQLETRTAGPPRLVGEASDAAD